MTSTVGLYVRVSRRGDREDERFHSPREQAERAAALAVAKGYVPGPVFEDIDVSGATAPAERPAMGHLLDAIDRGELGGIAAYSLDRLSREPSHGDALVKAVTRAGGVILTPDIPDAIDSPTGEFTFGMLLQVAKLYRSTAGARFATAKERAILAGIPVGPPPIGYRQRPDRRLELDPELAPVVRELFERYAAGEGSAPLLPLLDGATGRTWSRQAIPTIIRRRIYATGIMEYGDTRSLWNAGAIVDEPLWQAAQLPPRTPRPPRSTERPWLLSGLLVCAGCGRSLSPHSARPYRRKSDGHAKEYRNYRCVNRGCASRGHARAPALEQWVAIETFRVGDALVSRATSPDLGALEDALARGERRLDQVLAPEAQDALGDAWAPTVKARRMERDAAATSLGAARIAAGTPAVDFHLRDVWDDYSTTERKAALSLFWKAIRVGRPGETGTPLTFVARGPMMEMELELPRA